jgi:hypothetical protein
MSWSYSSGIVSWGSLISYCDGCKGLCMKVLLSCLNSEWHSEGIEEFDWYEIKCCLKLDKKSPTEVGQLKRIIGR